ILFITTATLTALSTWTRRTLFWSIAKAMFPISWSVFGLAVVAMLLAITYGSEIFVIKLPQIDISIDILTTLITAFGAAGVALASYLQYRSNKRELELDIAGAQVSQRALSEARQDVEVEQDV